MYSVETSKNIFETYRNYSYFIFFHLTLLKAHIRLHTFELTGIFRNLQFTSYIRNWKPWDLPFLQVGQFISNSSLHRVVGCEYWKSRQTTDRTPWSSGYHCYLTSLHRVQILTGKFQILQAAIWRCDGELLQSEYKIKV